MSVVECSKCPVQLLLIRLLGFLVLFSSVLVLLAVGGFGARCGGFSARCGGFGARCGGFGARCRGFGDHIRVFSDEI